MEPKSKDLTSLQRARVAVVEDDRGQAALMRRWLEDAGYEVVLYDDGAACLDALPRLAADAVILDMQLPRVSGLALFRALRAAAKSNDYLPVLVVTADPSPVLRERVLALGASDFLAKPVNRRELLLRARNHLRMRELSATLGTRNLVLAEQLGVRTRELDDAHLEILERLTRAATHRDDATGEHAQRVGVLAGALGRAVGLSDEQAVLLERAAPLHDIGKIGVPDAVLLKPGRHTPGERAVMGTHTSIGAQILGGSTVPVLKLAEEIARTHHERWDGTGALGLSGEDIPLPGRLVCVADVFDALTHGRPYKPAWPVSAAVAEIRRGSGTQFDPTVVDALLRVLHGGRAAPVPDGLPAGSGRGTRVEAA